jgi:hypothetical protein
MYDAPGSLPARALTHRTRPQVNIHKHTAGIFTPPLYLVVVVDVRLGAGEKRILNEYLDLAPPFGADN